MADPDSQHSTKATCGSPFLFEGKKKAPLGGGAHFGVKKLTTGSVWVHLIVMFASLNHLGVSWVRYVIRGLEAECYPKMYFFSLFFQGSVKTA